MSYDGLPFVGDPLELLVRQAGFHIPSPQIKGVPKNFLAPQGSVDPTNAMDQQGVPPAPGFPAGSSDVPGTQVDPRFLLAQAQGTAQAMNGVPADAAASLPARAPLVGVQTASAHPGIVAVAQALQQALANQQITPKTPGRDSFLAGLLGGASNTIVNADQKREATNAANRTAAAQMNLMNAAASAQQAKADAPSAPKPLTGDTAARVAADNAPMQLGTTDLTNLSPFLSDEQKARAAQGKLTRIEYNRAMQSAALELRKHPAFKPALGGTVAPTAPMTDANLNRLADLFNATGKISGVSSRDVQGMRMVTDRAAQRASGQPLGLNSAEYRANASSLSGVQKSADASAVFINQLHRNVAMIGPLLDQMSDTGSPFFNRPLRDVSNTVFGSKEIPAYNFVMETVRKEANRILTAGPSMAGQVGEGEQKAMRSVIDGNATADQLRTTLGVVLRESENRKAAYNDQIAYIKGRLGAQSSSAPKVAVIGPGNVRGYFNGTAAEARAAGFTVAQ